MYEIVVKRITKESVRRSKWEKLHDGYTDESQEVHPSDYGYAYEERMEDVEVEVFRQKVEDLNLATVVLVVNGIRPGLAAVFDPIMEELSRQQGQPQPPLV